MITATQIESLVDVKTMLEKQGFKVHSITTIKDFVKYDVTATYGDTNEGYAIIANPIKNEYTVEYKFPVSA
jgi:hypothetical protein